MKEPTCCQIGSFSCSASISSSSESVIIRKNEKIGTALTGDYLDSRCEQRDCHQEKLPATGEKIEKE
jgi:hypothetical protein